MKDFKKDDIKVDLNAVTKYLQTSGTFFSAGIRDIPKYSRPEWTTPKQHALINAVVNNVAKIYFVEGSQRTGKTTAIYLALHEVVLKHDPEMIRIDLMAGKGGISEIGGATRINSDLAFDPILRDVNHELIRYSIAKKKVWFNGSRMLCHETTVNDAKGADGEIVWCDEFDVALKKDPEAVMTLLFILLGRSDITIIISCNQDKGAYRLARDVLLKGEHRKDVWSIEFTDIDAPWIEAAGNMPILTELSNAIVGKSFTERRLHNVDLGEGEIWSRKLISNAMNSYNDWMDTLGDTEPDMVLIGVDGGFGHPTGIVVYGLYQLHIYEIELHNLFGADVSDDYIKTLGKELALAYGADVICEIQWGSKFWIKYWKEEGIKARGVVFTGDRETQTKNTRSRAYHCRELKMVMEAGRFHFCSPDLRSALVMYSLEGTSEKLKGSLVDATLHVVHKFLRSYPNIIFIES